MVPPSAMCSQYVVIVAKKKKTRKPHSESCSAHATCSQGQGCRLGIRVNGEGHGYGKVLAMRGMSTAPTGRRMSTRGEGWKHLQLPARLERVVHAHADRVVVRRQPLHHRLQLAVEVEAEPLHAVLQEAHLR